jgi:hypothetical protein
MLCLRRALLVVLLSCTALSAWAAPALADPGGISGTVTDSHTAPIPSVVVSVYDSSRNFVTSAFTDAKGSYAVGALAPGSYEVGFQSTSGNFAPQYYDNKSSIGSADPVTVSSGATTPQIDATLAQGGQVTGIIQDTSHAGIAGEAVEVLDSHGTVLGSANTAPDGSYTVVGLGTGTDYVQFSGGNYVTQYFNDKSTLAAANPVAVTAGSTTGGINATMAVGGGITGTVTDGGSGLPGALVSVIGTGGATVGSATTRFDGTYTVAGVPVGSYKVRFSDPGYVTQFFSDQQTLSTATTASVTTGGTTTGVDAAMIRAGQVAGTVTDANGPAQNVEVAAYDGSGNQVNAACTAADGTYTITDLPAGSYSIGFDTAGDGQCPTTNYLGQYWDATSTRSGANPVAVTPGATTMGVDATMLPAGQITGTVSDANGPLQSIEVDAYDGSGNRVGFPVCTTADGTYTVSGLATGSYAVGFNTGSRQCGNLNYLPQYYSDATALASATSVPVTAGSATHSIDAIMLHAGQISGTVTDANGPLQDIEVDAYDTSNNLLEEVCTAADGTYTLTRLTSGSYHVGFNTSGLNVCGLSNYLPRYYDSEASLPSADPVPVTAPSTTQHIDATLSAGAQISGRVTDKSSGDGVSPIRVVLLDTSGNPVTSTGTDASGNYTFLGLHDGSYKVEFLDSSGAYATQYWDNAPTAGVADPVAVTSTSPASGIDAALTTTVTPTLTIGANLGLGSGTVTSSPAGITCGSGCQVLFNEDTAVTLTASPAPGSAFAGWSGAGCSGTSTTCTVLMSEDQTVTARFDTVPEPTHTLTVGANPGAGAGDVTSSPSGIDCGTTCSSAFDDGTVVTLIAVPAPGSTFAGWSGACSGLSGQCEVTIGPDQSVTATFNVAPLTHVLTVGTSAGSGSGTVASSPSGITCGATCLHVFDDGTVVTLTASPGAGSTFAGWSGGACSGLTTTCQVTMSSNRSVTAIFNGGSAIPGGTGPGGTTPGGIAPGGTTGPGGPAGGHPTSAPRCTLSPSSRVSLTRSKRAPAGALAVTVRCDQAASITLAGKLTIRARSGRRTRTVTVSLGTTRARVGAGTATTERLKLSAAALRALRNGAGESAVLKLTATNAHGTNHSSATVLHLRRA